VKLIDKVIEKVSGELAGKREQFRKKISRSPSSQHFLLKGQRYQCPLCFAGLTG